MLNAPPSGPLLHDAWSAPLLGIQAVTPTADEYFWKVCPELTARWKEAMFTLPPSVLRDVAVEIKNLEAITKWANQQLHAALGAGGELAEDLLDRALASMENLTDAADTMTRLLDELLKG